MEKVLLAIDGIKPTHRAFHYAVELCERLKAELNVLQVIRPGDYKEYLKKIRRGARKARGYFEGSMMAAAFAEAGEHEAASDIMAEARKNINQLLPESEKAGVPCHLTMKAGWPSKEILRYVHSHHDVVLTIYDKATGEKTPRKTSKRSGVPGRIRKGLHVPLVVVRS